MGCLLSCFGCKSRKKVKDHRTRKRSDSLEEKIDADTEMAISLSLPERNHVAQWKREDTAWLGERNQHARAQQAEERRRHAQAWLEEEDEMFAKTIQESLNLEEEERRRAKAQLLEEDEQIAKTVQHSLNLEEPFPFQQEGKLSQHAKAQLEEDEQLAKTVQESLNMEGSLLRLQEEESNHAKAQLDEDEQLAKTIQENLRAQCSVHQQEKDKTTHLGDLFEEEKLVKALEESLDVKPPPNICAGCNSAIEYGRSLNLLDAVWHPQCFRCHACKKPIATQEFSKSRGQFHKSCYREQRHPRCFVCKEKIPSTAAGAEYKVHPFWLEKYCPSHEVDGTFKCCSCERLEPKGTKYLILDDGRRLCLECLDSAIMDTDECQPLYFDIREFFEGLQMKVEKQFPLLLVERQALNKAEEEEKTDRHHAVVTRGLCLSEEQIVTSVSRGPKKGANNRLTGMETESYRLTRECEVTAILIMYGLPRLLTGSILAHEMMHAWLRLSKYRNLKPEIEEGICQVLAHMWLETQTYPSSDAAASSSTSHVVATTSKKGDEPEFEKRLVGLFKNQIETDESSDYGHGFRKCNQAVSEYGLKDTLRSIQKTGGLPS